MEHELWNSTWPRGGPFYSPLTLCTCTLFFVRWHGASPNQRMFAPPREIELFSRRPSVPRTTTLRVYCVCSILSYCTSTHYSNLFLLPCTSLLVLSAYFAYGLACWLTLLTYSLPSLLTYVRPYIYITSPVDFLLPPRCDRRHGPAKSYSPTP